MASVVMVDIKENPLVVQSNNLVEARYSMTTGETKLVFAMVSAINKEDSDLTEYTFKASSLAGLLGISSKNLHRDLEGQLFKLQDRVIKIPLGKNDFFRTHWITGVKKIDGYYSLSFHKDLKPYLLELKDKFTQFRLLAITQFQGAYTIRIYTLLKQYERIGFREIKLSEFREILGIEKDKYIRFSDFRKRVLTQAKREFEKKNKVTGGYYSDITFDLETIKSGRNIEKLRFNIRKQSYQDTLPLELPEPEAVLPAMTALKKHGISEELAQKYISEEPEDDILRCVKLYEKAIQNGKVKNLNGGYLLTMLKAKAGKVTQAEIEIEAKEKKETKKQTEEKKKKALEEKRDKVIKDFRKLEVKKYLSSLSEADKKELLAEIKKEHSYLNITAGKLESPTLSAFYSSKIPNYKKNQKAYIKANL